MIGILLFAARRATSRWLNLFIMLSETRWLSSILLNSPSLLRMIKKHFTVVYIGKYICHQDLMRNYAKFHLKKHFFHITMKSRFLRGSLKMKAIKFHQIPHTDDCQMTLLSLMNCISQKLSAELRIFPPLFIPCTLHWCYQCESYTFFNK